MAPNLNVMGLGQCALTEFVYDFTDLLVQPRSTTYCSIGDILVDLIFRQSFVRGPVPLKLPSCARETINRSFLLLTPNSRTRRQSSQ